MKRIFGGAVKEERFHLQLFLMALSACAYGSFLNVYLGHLGYGNMVIGLFSTIPSLSGMLLQPILAAATDRARGKVLAMTLLTLIGAGTMVLMLVLSPRDGATTLSAAILMVVHTLYSAVQGTAVSLNTAMTMRHLNAHNAADRYGRIRVSWTAGYALAGVWVGQLTKADPRNFIPYAVVTALLALAVLPFLPWRQLTAPVEEKKEEGPRASIRDLVAYKELWILIGVVFLIGLANAFTYTFLPSYFMTLPGADNETFGWCISLRTVTEVPVLLCMGRIVAKLGIKKTLLIPALSTILRWLLLALVPTTDMVMATQFFHGFGYVVYSVAMTRYVAERLPEEMGSTAQNVMALLTTTAPSLVGGVLGALVIDTWKLGYVGHIWGNVILGAVSVVILAVLILRMPDGKTCTTDNSVVR